LLEAFARRWDETVGDEIPGTAAIIGELQHAGQPVFGLTNFSAETWPRALERYPVLRRLDGVVVSGEEGVRKPDRPIFEILRTRFALVPGRALFVDDLGVNVEAAIALGYLGHVFTNARALRATLVNLGALADAGSA
jgi:2-haloacid dehalogenase